MEPPHHNHTPSSSLRHSMTDNKLAGNEVPLYDRRGRWAGLRDSSVYNPKVLARLGAGRMCSAYIKQGIIGGESVTYISKYWSTSQQHLWEGFHSELALYKSDKYLRPLQGDVVPAIIDVHAHPGVISIAMELPHPKFWMEASVHMPDVLKERCIAAFEKIHARGILHNDVELRHMLVGADGKVTIVDFQASRALIPAASVLLRSATRDELRMEMRKVKFKLDYKDSREQETNKLIRCSERASRNAERWRKHGRTGIDIHDIPGYELDPEEDVIDPPVSATEWRERWIVPADDSDPNPKPICVPSQEPQEQIEVTVIPPSALGVSSQRAAISHRPSEADFSALPPNDSSHRYNFRSRHLPSEAPAVSSASTSPSTSKRTPAPTKVRDFAYEPPPPGPRPYTVPLPSRELQIETLRRKLVGEHNAAIKAMRLHQPYFISDGQKEWPGPPKPLLDSRGKQLKELSEDAFKTRSTLSGSSKRLREEDTESLPVHGRIQAKKQKLGHASTSTGEKRKRDATSSSDSEGQGTQGKPPVVREQPHMTPVLHVLDDVNIPELSPFTIFSMHYFHTKRDRQLGQHVLQSSRQPIRKAVRRSKSVTGTSTAVVDDLAIHLAMETLRLPSSSKRALTVGAAQRSQGPVTSASSTGSGGRWPWSWLFGRDSQGSPAPSSQTIISRPRRLGSSRAHAQRAGQALPRHASLSMSEEEQLVEDLCCTVDETDEPPRKRRRSRFWPF